MEGKQSTTAVTFVLVCLPVLVYSVLCQHEDGSVEMLEYLLNAENGRLRDEFEKYGLKGQDIDFIKEMIASRPLQKHRKEVQERKEDRLDIKDIPSPLQEHREEEEEEEEAKVCENSTWIFS